jgi:hypothetical protein
VNESEPRKAKLASTRPGSRLDQLTPPRGAGQLALAVFTILVTDVYKSATRHDVISGKWPTHTRAQGPRLGSIAYAEG